MSNKSSFVEGGYMAAMDISEDRKTVQIAIRSDIEMSDEDIILALEDWLNSNLLAGFREVQPGEY